AGMLGGHIPDFHVIFGIDYPITIAIEQFGHTGVRLLACGYYAFMMGYKRRREVGNAILQRIHACRCIVVEIARFIESLTYCSEAHHDAHRPAFLQQVVAFGNPRLEKGRSVSTLYTVG